jgi:anionic cell wall polymer biosynthesis LytR-Cps2A-Psr (LCP) family protein
MKNIPFPDFSHKIKNIDCPHCKINIQYLVPNNKIEIDTSYSDFFNQMQKGFDNLIDEMQDMFPETPLKEYIEIRKSKFKELIELLTKRINGNFSEIDEIKLKSNPYYSLTGGS